MNHRMYFIHRAGLALLVAAASAVSSSGAEPAAAPALQFPKIETYGSVVALPTAEERPRAGGKVVFDTTAAALTDAAHAKTTTGGVNPNRELVEKLLANGVEVWVCGQSVIRGGHALADVLPGIRIAHSAMIFNLNRQTDGWATIGVY